MARGIGLAKAIALQNGQGLIKPLGAPVTGQMSKLRPRREEWLPKDTQQFGSMALNSQGSSGLKPTAGFITGTRGGGCHHHGT